MNALLSTQTDPMMSAVVMVVYIVLIVAFIYFFMVRPQKKEQKKTSAMLANLAVGDYICTTNGFYGVIIDISDDAVVVEFGKNKNCRISMQKAAIAQVEKPDQAVSSTAENK